MAGPAEQPVVLEPAFAAAVGDRDNVVRFPARPLGAPGPPGGAIASRRFAPGPLAMRLDDVHSADLARALVAFLDLTPHVPRTAANLPFVDARLAAECAARRLYWRLAPPADRLTLFIPFGNTPLIR